MEHKFNPEERAYIASKLEESKLIAYSLGERMFEATNDIGVSLHAAAILYATTCAINNIEADMAHKLLDMMHNQITEAMNLEGGTLQ